MCAPGRRWHKAAPNGTDSAKTWQDNRWGTGWRLPSRVPAPTRTGVDSRASVSMLHRMTATKVIEQIKTMPARERRKVIRYVVSEAERREDKSTARRWPRRDEIGARQCGGKRQRNASACPECFDLA
jgi:hypothetical protein